MPTAMLPNRRAFLALSGTRHSGDILFCYLAAETDSILAGKKLAWGIANSLWPFKAS